MKRIRFRKRAPSRRARWPALGPAWLVLALVTGTAISVLPGAEVRSSPPLAACRSRAVPGLVDPDSVTLSPSRAAHGAAGRMVLRPTPSPFGVAVTPDGSYSYQVTVEVTRARTAPGRTLVAWAATPGLDRHVKLGVVTPGEAGSEAGSGTEGGVTGRVTWNKFLVFVTAEADPSVERWSQEILLSALAPAGRMHTMAGHGPFSGEPCMDPRN